MSRTKNQLAANTSTGNPKPALRLSLADYLANPRYTTKARKATPRNSSDSDQATPESRPTSSETQLTIANPACIALRIPNNAKELKTSPVAPPQKLVLPTGPVHAALTELEELQKQAKHDKTRFTAFQLEQIAIQILCWQQLKMLGEKNGPKDLRKLAEKVLIKHKAEIISVGEIAYNVIYPVLRSIDSAPQLKIIEKNSPHICYEDQELWKKLITKDFGPGALSKFKLEDNNRWSALYDKHREEQAREHDRVARSMKKVMEATEAQKKTMTTKLDRTLVMPARKGRSTGDGWGARNNWDAKVGIKIKDIVKKSKIEADQVALRNKSAKKPVAHAQINPNMAEALRMRHQNRVELTTNASKKRTHTEEPPHKTSPPKKARTTGLEPRTQPKIATKEDRRQKDVSQPLRRQDGRPHEARTQQERTQQERTQQERTQQERTQQHHSQQDHRQQDHRQQDHRQQDHRQQDHRQQDRRQQDRRQQDRRIDSDRRRDSEKHYYGDRRNDSDRRIDNRQHPYRRT